MKDKKTAITLTVVAVTMLVLITIGGTYAYFSIQKGESSNTTLIQGNVANAGIVTGEKGVTNAVINLSNADMTNENAGKYYATAAEGSNYSVDEEILNVFKASLANSAKGEQYTCTFDFKVTVTGNESLAEGDAVLNITGTGNKDIDTSHDLSTLDEANLTKQITWKFTKDNSKYLNISAYIENKKDVEQNSSLPNANIGIQTSVENFTCSVGEYNDNTLASYLINNVSETELWNSTLEDDGYRYVGTNPSNYICFGTSDKEACTGDTDKYMYRIIGIFEDSSGNQHVKLIKKEALNTTYQWHSSYKTDTAWNASDLYNGLNGSYFLTNTSYPYMQNETWTNKISTWNYTMTNTLTYSSGGLHYYHNTGKVMYLHELNRSSKTSQTCYASSNTASCSVGTWKKLSTKISLMYASDYALSLGSAALSYTSNSNYNTMKTGWMHITNSDTGNPVSNYEWTMSRYGYYGDYYAWYVYSDGFVTWDNLNYTFAVRPVFYLESEVEYLSGSGTLSDPYMIIS